MANEQFLWRKTTFVELMVPVFSKQFMPRAIETFGLSASGTGFGLDVLWPALLKYEDIYIFDDVQVRHTRPVGAFRFEELSKAAERDFQKFAHVLRMPLLQQVTEALGRDGQILTGNSTEFLVSYLFGYRYLIPYVNNFVDQVTQIQSSPTPKAITERSSQILDFFLNRSRGNAASLACGRPALVSSVSEYSRSKDPAIEASGGNDGIIDGHCKFHTAFETDPWWQVDLETAIQIARIDVYNRLDMKSRCVNLAVLVSHDAQTWSLAASKIDNIEFGGADGDFWTVEFHPKILARYVRIQMIGSGFLHLDQIEIFDQHEPGSSTKIAHSVTELS